MPCIPTRGTKVPHHPDWVHEVKQDGFRLIVQRDGDRVRLFTRNGHNWTSRYPLIVEADARLVFNWGAFPSCVPCPPSVAKVRTLFRPAVTQRGPWIRFVGRWLPDSGLTQNAAVIVIRVLEADGLSVWRFPHSWIR